MCNITPLQYLAHHAASSLQRVNRGLLSTPRQSNRSPKRKHRKSASSRGRLNSTFNQFLDATRFVRNTIKYICIIWALVLGVYVLFYFASQAAWRLQSTEQGNAIAETAHTPSNIGPIKDLANAPNEDPVAAKKLATPEETAANTTVVALNAEQSAIDLPASISSPAPLTPTKPVTPESPAISNPSPGPVLKISAYRAMLFDSIDREDAKQTPLDKDSTIFFIERRAEWIKVFIPGTQETGYVHSSQVTTD